jgi:hypothetical protein
MIARGDAAAGREAAAARPLPRPDLDGSDVGAEEGRDLGRVGDRGHVAGLLDGAAAGGRNEGGEVIDDGAGGGGAAVGVQEEGGDGEGAQGGLGDASVEGGGDADAVEERGGFDEVGALLVAEELPVGGAAPVGDEAPLGGLWVARVDGGEAVGGDSVTLGGEVGGAAAIEELEDDRLEEGEAGCSARSLEGVQEGDEAAEGVADEVEGGAQVEVAEEVVEHAEGGGEELVGEDLRGGVGAAVAGEIRGDEAVAGAEQAGVAAPLQAGGGAGVEEEERAAFAAIFVVDPQAAVVEVRHRWTQGTRARGR